METVAISSIATPPFVAEEQSSMRCMIEHLIAINQQGTGQVTSIDSRGLSFGCLYRHQFPKEWSMDILDSRGSHVKQLQVKKTWEEMGSSSNFEVEIGVEFTELSFLQKEELDSLLTNLDFFHS